MSGFGGFSAFLIMGVRRRSDGVGQVIKLVVEDQGHGAQVVCALLEQEGFS